MSRLVVLALMAMALAPGVTEAYNANNQADSASDEDEVGGAPEVRSCYGRWCYSAADTLAALDQVGPRTRCTLRYEIGQSWRDPRTGFVEPAWSPNMYNAASGVVGPGQLCCLAAYQRAGYQYIGLLPRFMASREDADPWNPYQVVPWTMAQILAGQGSHWYAIRAGLC